MFRAGRVRARRSSGTALALQLLAGDTAFLSGPTAGALHGLRGMPTQPIEIAVGSRTSRGSRRRTGSCGRPGIVDGRDVETRDDGIRVATPLRTLFGLARRFNQHRFERAAEDLWHKGLVTPTRRPSTSPRSAGPARAASAAWSTGWTKSALRQRPAQSGLELDLIAMIERVGLPTPVRQLPLTLPSGETIHLDLAWPDVRLAIEPGHSWWHGGDLRQRADQARDRACALVGWHVHRYDEAAAADPAATAREIAGPLPAAGRPTSAVLVRSCAR